MSLPVPEDLALHVAKGDKRQAPVVPRRQGLPRVLCVDDDARLLAGLELRLRRSFNVVTATTAADALARLDRSVPYAVVVSDMRMPNADGTRFLSAIRRVAPETTRILLTGQADVASAIAAVNEGEIFRFLLKPIEAPQLIAVIEEGVARHRAILAQQTVTEDVLRGAVDLILASMTSLAPMLSAQCARVRALVAELAASAAPKQAWIPELATVLIHLSLARVDADVSQRWRARLPLSVEEIKRVDAALHETVALLRHIPQSEPLIDAIGTIAPRHDGRAWGTPPLGASAAIRIMHLVLQFDASLQRGIRSSDTIAALRESATPDDLPLIALLATAPSKLDPGTTRGPLGRVQPGRRITHDVRLPNGILFLPKGHDVTVNTLAMIEELDLESRQVQVITIASPHSASAQVHVPGAPLAAHAPASAPASPPLGAMSAEDGELSRERALAALERAAAPRPHPAPKG